MEKMHENMHVLCMKHENNVLCMKRENIHVYAEA